MRIALIQMPFAVTTWPSLGLSLLKAVLAGRGHEVDVIYANIWFAEQTDPEIYNKLASGSPQNCDLAGEWVFASHFWNSDPLARTAFLNEILRGRHPSHKKNVDPDLLEPFVAATERLSKQIPAYLRECLTRVDWSQYDLVGFTSVFQQQLASLCLARELRERFPSLEIVFGGANCEAAMGAALLEAFPFISAVCSGEGENAFADYVDGLAERHVGTDLGEVSARACGRLITPVGMVDLDKLPIPDFHDFFQQHRSSRLPADPSLRLLFETSRGCWWGEKNHCTFCGLNGTTMAFRHKSSERALEEIEQLVQIYGEHTSKMSATDNIIPYRYFKDFLPRLAERELDLDIFYETKANLKKEQVELYRAAGLTAIQPGIESLQSDVLRLMRKGVSGLQNVQLLKWCAQYGIRVHWNYLCGFPGEAAASYERAADIVPLLTHLSPPEGFSRLRFDRFSPYMEDPAAFGLTNVRRYPAYDHIYPGVPCEARERLAYYFVADFSLPEDVEDSWEKVRSSVDRWKKCDTSTLCHVRTDAGTIIFDTRVEDEGKCYLLTGASEWVLHACDSIQSTDQIEAADWGASSEYRRALDQLIGLGLLVREDRQVVALSIALGEYYSLSPGAAQRIDGFYREQTEGGDATLELEDSLVCVLN